MLTEYRLDKAAAVEYAQKWAKSRNPMYYDFEDIGGDCTSFVSQCLRAGGAVMNYTRDTGWYYNTSYDRSASWSSVFYLHKFLTENVGAGPFGKEVPVDTASVGDIIQLGNDEKFYHSLFVTDKRGGRIYVCAHTNNAYNIPLSYYEYKKARCINILGARRYE